MKDDVYLRETFEFSRQHNPFKSVDYWKQKRLTTLRARTQIGRYRYVSQSVVPLLKHCYDVVGGDPWTKLQLPGQY